MNNDKLKDSTGMQDATYFATGHGSVAAPMAVQGQSNLPNKCGGCNGNGMVGNILDSDTCPFCHGTGAAAPAAQVLAQPDDDLLDVVRTLCSIAARMRELPDEKRQYYPSPTCEGSPLLMAARTACLKRGYTVDGLSTDATPVAAGAHPVAGEDLISTITEAIAHLEQESPRAAQLLLRKLRSNLRLAATQPAAGPANIKTWQDRCTDGKHNFATFNDARDAEIGELRAALARHSAAPVEPEKLSVEQSKEYLVKFMEQHFTDKTYHRYIRGERDGNKLAGDFAWQMARALRMIAAPVDASAPDAEKLKAAQTEAAAKAIYERFDGAPEHPWVPGGNSIKQDDARHIARAALGAAEALAKPAVAPVAGQDELFMQACRVALVALAHAAEKHGIYQTDYERFDAAIKARAALAAPVAEAQPVADKVYVEARECDACNHVGINDSDDVLATCDSCDWSGPSPLEDICPGCDAHGTMGAACPKCGGRYRLLADKYITAPVAPKEAGPVPTDAYAGAREDLAIWKKRALEAEESCRHLVATLNEESGPTFMGEPALAAIVAPAPQAAEAVPFKLVDITSHPGWANLIYTGADCEGLCIAMVHPPVAAALHAILAAHNQPAQQAEARDAGQKGGAA